MVNIINNLNDTLSSLNTIGLDNLQKSANDLVSRELAGSVSNLGIEVGAVTNGIKTLTQQADDITSLPASVTSQLINKTGIAELGGNIPGANLDVPAVIISSAAPEALSAAMKSAKVDPSVIKSNLSAIQPTSFGNLDDIAAGVSIDSFKQAAIQKATKQLTSAVKKINVGVGTILGDILENEVLNVKSVITNLANLDGSLIDIPIDLQRKITSLVVKKDLDAAVKLLQPFSSESASEIKKQLTAIDTTLSKAEATNISSAGNKTSRTAGQAEGKKVKNTELKDNQYPFIATEEELTVELKDISREITECIIQWTETAKDQNLTARDFNDLLAINDKTIPYHYLILRNGNLQRCKSVREIGGKLNNGHEKYSIQIAFVGGIDANSNVKDYTQHLSSRSLTIPQRKTMHTFLRILYSAYPGIQVLGHNSIDRKNRAPGFSVENYIFDVFKKANVLDDPLDSGPLSRNQLINKV